MVASVLVLKERMRITQVIGAGMLICGLLLFFNTSLHEIFTRLTDYTLGVALGVCAAVVWVSYGVAQKVLLRRMASQQFYYCCTLYVRLHCFHWRNLLSFFSLAGGSLPVYCFVVLIPW